MLGIDTYPSNFSMRGHAIEFSCRMHANSVTILSAGSQFGLIILLLIEC